MGQSLAAIIIGAAGLLVLIVYKITETKQIEQFRKDLIDEFRDTDDASCSGKEGKR